MPGEIFDEKVGAQPVEVFCVVLVKQVVAGGCGARKIRERLRGDFGLCRGAVAFRAKERAVLSWSSARVSNSAESCVPMGSGNPFSSA